MTVSDSSDPHRPTPPAAPGEGTEPSDPDASGDDASAPAPALGRLALTVTPFLVLAGVFWLLKLVSG